MVKIISWNVNGIRAALKKGFVKFVEKENPDILCLQEIKAHPEQVDIKLADDFEHHFWNPAKRPGYSGTAVFSKIKPLKVINGIGLLDEEGRVQTLEFEGFYLVNCYTPNSKRDLSRLDFRYNEWDITFRKHLKALEKDKPVIFCGDLNCTYTEDDIARPASNKTTATKPGSAGFTDKERERFGELLACGFIDTFRHIYPEKIQYTWWSNMNNARANNVGWRIDYFGVSPELRKKIKSAKILDNVLGSDHCPVLLEIE
jgi:exodeoxyribonuclease-3